MIANCGDPLEQCYNDIDDFIIAVGYSSPALEGYSIDFKCLVPGLTLTGPNASICMGNGEWEPDP